MVKQELNDSMCIPETLLGTPFVNIEENILKLAKGVHSWAHAKVSKKIWKVLCNNQALKRMKLCKCIHNSIRLTLISFYVEQRRLVQR